MREYHKMLKGARSVLGVLVIFGRPLGSALRTDQRMQSRGFSLIELMIVTVIVGLLAGLALPQFDAVSERAFDSATIAELDSAVDELERYFVEHFEYPSSEDDLFADGFALSPDISFLKFSRSGSSNPSLASIHMHITHAGSAHYFHYDYPRGLAEIPELRWK